MRAYFRLCVLVGLLLSPAIATAQTTPASQEAPIKSPGLALGLSIALPMAGMGLIATGVALEGSNTLTLVMAAEGAALFLAGPSAGQFYVGQFTRGGAFTAGRVALFMSMFFLVGKGIEYGDSSESDYKPGFAWAAQIGALVCASGIMGLSVWESIDAYRSAERINLKSRTAVTVTPMLLPERATGSWLAGLAVTGTY